MDTTELSTPSDPSVACAPLGASEEGSQMRVLSIGHIARVRRWLSFRTLPPQDEIVGDAQARETSSGRPAC